MIAYKTYSTIEVDKKPTGIPDAWPCEEMAIQAGDQAYYEGLGFTVVSESDYADLKATVQAANASWFTNYQLSLIPYAIDKRILYYQLIAPKIIRDLFVSNTIAGISTSQSNQMFDDYEDVLIRLKEGAFPTAYKRLELKRPSGFVTQTIIDNWKSKIFAVII